MVKVPLSQQDSFKTDQISPGEPVGPTVIHEDTRNISIEWNKPEASLYVLDHYKVQWERTQKARQPRNAMLGSESSKPLHITILKSEQKEKNGYASEFVEVSAETKSMAGKVAKVVGAGVGTGAVGVAVLVAYPVAASVFFGAGAGVVAAESIEDKARVLRLPQALQLE